MNIHLINCSLTNSVFNYNPLNNRKASFGSYGKYFGDPRTTIDMVALENKAKPSDDKCCEEILKNAKLNGKARFSPIEQKSIMRDFKRSLSITARAPFLEEILKLRYSDGAALKSGDIASFFYVTKGCTRSRTTTAFNILKYYVRNHKEKTSIQLDDAVFLPLENNDKILDELSAVSAFFSDSERGKVLFDTLDIVKASGYDFVKYTKDIAHNLKKDKTDIVHKILKGAAEYAYQDKISNNKSKCITKPFKELLISFSPDRLNEMWNDMKTLPPDLIDEYVRNRVLDFYETRHFI